MLDLIWEPEALDQLDGIIDFIGERNGPAADRMARLFAERAERIRRFPEMGRPGRVTGTRELIVHPNYILIYRVTETAIDILRVLHVRQQYP